MTPRNKLKQRLLDERHLCDWCGQELYGEGDMHEWLVKRNVLPKDKRIFDERNCAILHHRCHMEYGQTKAMQQKLASLFTRRYGAKNMVMFIDSLALKAPKQFINIIRNFTSD